MKTEEVDVITEIISVAEVGTAPSSEETLLIRHACNVVAEIQQTIINQHLRNLCGLWNCLLRC